MVAGLAATGVRIAIATTGRREWVEPLAGLLLGADVVEVEVTGDDVANLKPDPEVYLRVLDELGVSASDALAVEDSAIGLQAASRAGLATIAVPNGYPADQDLTGAAAVLPGFDVAGPPLASRFHQVHARWWAHSSS